MTNKEILTKAILKATNNSWKVPNWILAETKYNNWDFVADERVWPTVIFNHDFAKALWGKDKPFEGAEYLPHLVPARIFMPEQLGYKDYQSVIDELWVCMNCGEEWEDTFNRRCLLVKESEPGYGKYHHLQQMVIADDPIKYLGDHI